MAIHTSSRGSPNGYGGGSSAEDFQVQAVNSNRDRKRKGRKIKERKLRLATWNIQGWRTKREEVLEEFKNMNVDILVVTETKKKGNGTEEIGGALHIWSGVKKEQRAKAGVGILVKKKFRKNIKTWEPVNERVIRVEIAIYGRDVIIIGAYGPNDDSPVTEKEKFLDTIQNEIANIRKKELIIAGDLNGRVGRKENDSVIGRFGEEITNDNGERVIEICELNDLKVTNGFFRHKDIHRYTWTQETRELKSIIDYIIIRRRSTIKIRDVRVQRGAECGSDHRLLLAKMEFPWMNRKTNNIEGTPIEIQKRKPLKIQLLQDESTRHLYQTRLDQKLIEFRYDDNMEDTYQHIKESMLQAGMEALGEVEGKQRPFEYNLSETTINEIKCKKQLYNKWLSTRNEDDYKKYREKNRDVKGMVNREKNENWEKTCQNLDQYIGGARRSEAWRVIKELRSDRKERSYISYIEPEKWKDHYKDLLTETRQKFIEERQEEEGQPRAQHIPITIEDIRKAIKTIKNKKAGGPGDIAPELIKCGTEKLFRIIHGMFGKAINGHNIPDEWKEAQLTSIFKKGDRRQCDNYRGISVIATMGRLYGRVLRDKLEQNIQGKIGEEQAGFTAGRSCIDHIYTIQQLLEKKKAKNKPVHLAFIDLKKAYDTVPRKELWKAMERLDIPITLTNAMKTLYRNNKIHIKVGNKIVNSLTTSKGLLQGCPTSPTLFKIFLEHALTTWKRKCEGMGIPLRNEHLYTLCFADDQVVMAQDEEDLSYMLRKLNEEYEKVGLEINLKKTMYMTTEEDTADLQIEDHLEIKGTNNFKYLGFTLSKNATTEEDINVRLGQTRSCIQQLHSVIWDRNIRKKTKTLIYETIIQSIMTYAAEVWVINKNNQRKILATEMMYWRRCCGLTRRDRVTNEEIRRRMGRKTDVLKYIETKRLVWYGHVRRAENRWINRVTEWSPIGRRKRGRPRRSWRDEVDESMHRRGLREGTWDDRDEWRTRLMEGRQPEL